MKRVRSAYQEYLKRIDRLDEIKLGGKRKLRTVTDEDNEFFKQLLQRQLSFNKKVAILYIILLCIVFGIEVFLIFFNLDSKGIMGLISALAGLSLIAIVEKLRRLWREKSMMDITLNIVKNLPPQETVKVLETLYWSSIAKKNE